MALNAVRRTHTLKEVSKLLPVHVVRNAIQREQPNIPRSVRFRSIRKDCCDVSPGEIDGPNSRFREVRLRRSEGCISARSGFWSVYIMRVCSSRIVRRSLCQEMRKDDGAAGWIPRCVAGYSPQKQKRHAEMQSSVRLWKRERCRRWIATAREGTVVWMYEEAVVSKSEREKQERLELSHWREVRKTCCHRHSR